ncbi:MAG: hypothetical protein AB7U20_17335 [Planctomycetaceae bacterium]
MHDLATDLPPPRDDEPASLRQDIVDELADHLQCALRRELLASRGRQSPDGGGSPTRRETASEDSSFRTEWQHVLARFGNPAAVARKLWLDAMQERLMAQKITLLLASVATAAVVALSVLMWQAQQRAAEAQRLANEAQLALIQQHEQFSASILKTLESLRTAPSAPAPAPAAASPAADGWSPLTIKLVSEDGEPVAGKIRVYGNQFGGGDKTQINLDNATGPEGVVDFGLVPYGNYTMSVTATAANETHTERIMVGPGRPSELNVVCPTSPPPEVEMKLLFDPPKTLKAERLQYVVELAVVPRQIGGNNWSWAEVGDTVLSLCVDHTGSLTHRVRLDHSISTREGRTSFNLYAQFLSAAPTLRAYSYQVRKISVFVPAIGYDRTPDFRGRVDQWAVVADLSYVPGETGATLEPRTGTENSFEINVVEADWNTALQLFRKTSYARHVTIPAGMQAVDIAIDGTLSPDVMKWLLPGREGRSASSSDRIPVDVLFVEPASAAADEEPATIKALVRSAELLVLPDPRSLLQSAFPGRINHTDRSVETPGEAPRARITVSVLVTDAQADAIRLARQKGSLSIRPAEEESATPTLDEQVLEELRALPDAEPSESRP